MHNTTPVEELEGRALDAAVAEEVMGLDARWKDGTLLSYENGEPETALGPMAHGIVHVTIPHYSTDIAAAWEVLTEMQSRDEYDRFSLLVEAGRLTVTVVRNSDDVRGQYPPIFPSTDTAPLAICRAALKAVRSDQ